MGELSFRYKVKNKHKLIHAFKYWSNKIAEYGFAYQRFVALYDTRIFDSPVVITKVATGLSSILGIFTSKKERDTDSIVFEGVNFIKDGKSIEHPDKYAPFYIEKDGKSFIVMTDALFVNDDRNINYTSWYKDRVFVMNSRTLSRIATYNKIVSGSMRPSFSIYGNISAAERMKIGNIYRTLLGEPSRNDFNIYDNILGKPHGYTGQMYENLLGKPDRLGMSIYINYLGRPDRYGFNILPTILGIPPEIVGNINNTLLGKPRFPITVNYVDSPSGDRINDDKLSYYENIYGSPSDKYGIIERDFLVHKQTVQTLLADKLYGGIITNPIVNYYIPVEIGSAYKTIEEHLVSPIILGFRENIRVFYEYYMSLGEPEKKYSILHKNNFGYTHPLSGNTVADNIFIGKIMPQAEMANTGLSLGTRIKYSDTAKVLYGKRSEYAGSVSADEFLIQDIFYGQTFKDPVSFDKQKGKSFTTKDASFRRSNIFGAISQEDFVNQKERAVDNLVDNIFVYRVPQNAMTLNQIWIFGNQRDILLYHSAEWIYKIPKDMITFEKSSSNNKDIYVYKNIATEDGKSMWILNNLFIGKYKQSIWEEDSMSAHKPSISMYLTSGMYSFKKYFDMLLHDAHVDAYKVKKDIARYSQTSISRDRYEVYTNPYYLWTHKIPNSVFSANPAVGAYKKRVLGFYSFAMSLLKEAISVQNTGALDGAIKSLHHIRLNNFGSSHNGLIIPVTKTYYNVSAFNDEVGEIVEKTGKYVSLHVTDNAMATALKKPIWLDFLDYLGAEKVYHGVMMSVYNYFATKVAVKMSIQKGLWGYLLPSDMSIYYPGVWVEKERVELYIPYDTWAEKQQHNFSVYDQIFLDIHKLKFNTSIYKSEFVEKSNYGLYYFYDVWAEKTKVEMSKFNGVQATIHAEDLRLYNAMPQFDINRDLALHDPVVYGPASLEDLTVVQQLKEFEKSRAEIAEFLSDFGNWAWVYEAPSPFESKTYGIDELLLPEADPRYEQFEDIIFDKENLVPRDPIKVLSPTSFLARYPIEMPIEEFADIGHIYEDSAEKWEQYFGIQTDVMRDIYLKYYQIWQAKIFEFSTMTMVQSTKKMLEYLYTWIDMYYPIEKMAQALRVFRQIRWFSECAVIRNSQYIISYEYDTLRSNLHTGECHIPNDLDIVTNPTMYIDKQNAVIRNDKAFIGQSAHVTFTIDNQKNTYIKFDLYTEFGKGTVLIYLNNTLVRACTSAALGVIIQIPYTGTENSVTIIKETSNNIGDFYIGNISIPDASFKDLNIEFDPVLRAGNKPLEEVAQKMIACANLFANKNEMYAVIKRSSLGFSETYRQMNEYWKLHHQNKIKGKRLTIKQV